MATIIILGLWAVLMGVCIVSGTIGAGAFDREDTEPMVNPQRWIVVDREFRRTGEAVAWPDLVIGGEGESCD